MQTPAFKPPLSPQPVCAFTIDVEDWFQSSVDAEAMISERVLWNMERVLRLLDQCRVKATFFMQGRVAECFPRMVQDLVAEGHEVQSHGHSHRLLFQMNRHELRAELETGRKTVEDVIGRPVTAFRAPDFSIMRRNYWALEEVAAAGFQVDSSIFPMRMRRYGIADWNPAPQRLVFPSQGKSLWEVPVAAASLGRWRFPVGGGGYMRLWPRWLMARALQSVVDEGRPVVLYCHPYDFNVADLADYRGKAPNWFLFTQGLGRASLANCVRHLFRTLQFGRLDEVLSYWGIAAAQEPSSNQSHPQPASARVTTTFEAPQAEPRFGFQPHLP